MSDYQILRKGDLTPAQIKGIVEGRAQIPPEYPLGTPEYISLQLAQQNHLLAQNNDLLGARNRYLRFIQWIVAGAAVVTLVGLSYLNYTLDKLEKKIERNNVALEQSVDELSASFTSLGDTVKHFENSSYTSLGEISKSFEMINYQISEELKKMSEELRNVGNDFYQTGEELNKIREELNNARKDLRDARADLLKNVGNDLRGIQGDLESVVEPNSIK